MKWSWKRFLARRAGARDGRRWLSVLREAGSAPYLRRLEAEAAAEISRRVSAWCRDQIPTRRRYIVTARPAASEWSDRDALRRNIIDMTVDEVSRWERGAFGLELQREADRFRAVAEAYAEGLTREWPENQDLPREILRFEVRLPHFNQDNWAERTGEFGVIPDSFALVAAPSGQEEDGHHG